MTRSRIANSIVPIFIATAIVSNMQASQAATPIALVPKPLRLERTPGEFVLSGDTVILADKDVPDAAAVGKLLAERIRRATGFPMAVKPYDGTRASRGAIVLTNKMRKDAAALGREGYTLVATPERVTIAAGGGAGLFYGTQTLLQLLPPQIFAAAKIETGVAWTLPAVQIEDKPRFGWRGLLLDVARHFFNKREIENFIDLMAEHKLNMLQLHLTDNEGWRIEIKRYPLLTAKSAWRTEDPFLGTKYPAGKPYGGFFTQQEMREIVAYAKARYVNVVPEIEMPAHAGGALAAYPELSCTGKPLGEFCPGNEATYEFLEGVLTEVLQVFPSKYIHIGGDEASKSSWKTCPKCQSRMKREGLENEEQLQSYFIRRIERFLNAHGRVLVGWDEILEGGVAPNAVVMSWRGIAGGVTAANAGHDVVMTPTTNCYFDYAQEAAGEPGTWGDSVISLRRVYAFDPIPRALSGKSGAHVLGGGGNLWTEVIPNYARAQYMTYPRACALAEATWSVAKSRDWRDFCRRLEAHLRRLKMQQVNYRQPKREELR